MRQEELVRRCEALLEAPQVSVIGPEVRVIFGRFQRAEVELYCRNGSVIEIVSIDTPPAHRGQGHAGAAMTAICNLADELGLDISVRPMPVGTSLSVEQLTEWYRRHGFEPAGDDLQGHWIRSSTATGSAVGAA